MRESSWGPDHDEKALIFTEFNAAAKIIRDVLYFMVQGNLGNYLSELVASTFIILFRDIRCLIGIHGSTTTKSPSQFPGTGKPETIAVYMPLERMA